MGLPFVVSIVRCGETCLLQTNDRDASSVGSYVIENPILPSNPHYPQLPASPPLENGVEQGRQKRSCTPSHLVVNQRAYRGAWRIRNRPSPLDPQRALGMVLL